MITKVQQDMEDTFYDILNKGDVGKKIIEKYPHQTISELAASMTEGMMTSYVGGVVCGLDSLGQVDGFKVICKGAFKAAMLKLLREAKKESEVT